MADSRRTPAAIALDHTHHDKRTAVDSERPAERVCSSTKPGPPEALADHRQVLGPVVGLVIAEESPDPCADAERAEQLAADELGVFEDRISAGRDGDRDGLGLTIRQVPRGQMPLRASRARPQCCRTRTLNDLAIERAP